MITTASIVTYKHKITDLQELIISLLDSSIMKLFIIDNSPNEELQAYIKFEKTEYIFTSNNIGYGAGHNIALKKAIDLNSEYHIIINPDISLVPSVINEMLEYVGRNPSIGNLMPKVVYPDGSLQYLCKLLPTPYDWIGRRFNPISKLVEKRNNLFELRFTGYEKIMEVPYLSGCFMLLNVGALKRIGLFDENIFMYGEDTDICRRLIIEGYKNVYYPWTVIKHEFQKESHKSWRLTWIGIKSAIYYFNKWGWFIDKDRVRINQFALRSL
jgi:GT2 family glycosyltransferase